MGPCMNPLGLAQRNSQANEAADCGGTGEPLPGEKREKESRAEKKGPGRTGWFDVCAEQLR